MSLFYAIHLCKVDNLLMQFAKIEIKKNNFYAFFNLKDVTLLKISKLGNLENKDFS